ncbi:SAM-dependent chlorinase/fluorinase [Microlunatus elymi]|uniref:SAM-dependent chlorinase/fluorinase n=1 Tax=Microlunatus elymi TaxID=2596828 RepID=A0A516Q019_9ACTN|nr:SAM-dependent chlorinase/fluorinase [Microlunatus elymi]QDP96774.1 SAM-dependent chlorinase/fluorinase [Microlunatus elymi]
MSYDWISLLTDFGTYDGFVAQCKGSIARIAPAVRWIDVTHEIPAQDVRRGAAVLSQIVGQLPPAVHLAVVDPGVGTDRRGVALQTPGGVLVGPDNGLLGWAADVLGGVRKAVALTNTDYHLGTSNTFHGRDIFSPVAAHTAVGVSLDDLGDPVDPAELVRLPDPVLSVGSGQLDCEVLTIDHYGNLQTSASAAALTRAGFERGDRLEWAIGDHRLTVLFGRTYGEVPPGDALAYLDSAAFLSLGVNGANAAARLGIPPGTPITISGAALGRD